MTSAGCQGIQGACIVGTPTPTGIRAEHDQALLKIFDLLLFFSIFQAYKANTPR
jgi:hypothetical protein